MPFEVTKVGEQPAGRFEVTKLGTGEPTAQPEETEEGWLPYTGRNVAKVLGLVYATGASGAGLGDVFRELQEAGLPRLGSQEHELPTFGEALEKYGKNAGGAADTVAGLFGGAPGWGKTLTESRPEDYWPEMIAQVGLPALLTGGLSSGPAVLRTLGMLGGGLIGGSLGESVLGQFGLPKTGNFLGNIAGGIGGAKAAKFAGEFPTPTRSLPAEVTKNETILAEQAQRAAQEQLQARRQDFETKQISQLEELHKKYPSEVQQLIKEEKRLKEAVPLEADEFNKYKQKRIENIEERKTTYDKEIQNLYKIMKENAEKHESLANGEISKHSGKVLANITNEARNNLELLDDRDRKRFINFVDAIDGKIQTTGLTLNDAKDWYKKANSMIFSESTAPEMKSALHDVMTPKGGLRDYIKTTGSPEHTEAWTSYNDAYSRQKNLEKSRPDFIAEQNAEKNAIRSEKLEEHPKFAAREQAKEAMQKREAIEKEYKEAVKIIGEKTFEDILRSEQQQKALETKFTEALEALPEKINKPGKLDEIAGRYGAAAMGSALGYIFGGKIGSVLGGLTGKFAQYGAKQMKYAQEVFKTHPDLKRQYYKLVKDSTKLTSNEIAGRLLSLGIQTQHYAGVNEKR